MELKEALASLDMENDEQWTKDGLPKVDVVAALVEDENLTRSAITDAAPQFTRENPVIEIPEPNEDEDVDDEQANAEEASDDDDGDDSGEDVTDDDDSEKQEKADVIAEEARAALLALEPVKPLAFYKALMSMDADEAEAAAKESSRAASVLMEHKREIEKMIAEHHQNMSNAKQRVESLTPRNRPQMQIMDHIRKQNEMRAQKAGVASAVKTALGGVKLSDLDPRSPLDQAMARKTKRGTQRPARI